jgi:hypothetical protein
MFKKTQELKAEVFSPVSGRIFDSTWGGRKTASALINSPIDALEHVCRLQNWSATSVTPTLGWGRAYADAPLIKTGAGEGSFDDSNSDLRILDGYSIASQIIDYSDGDTDKVKRAICRNFFLANYIDKNGYECVKRITKNSAVPVTTITFADIMDRKQIQVSEPNPLDIYSEPFVNYEYNQASQKFEKTIAVRNALAPAYSISFVEGLTDSEGQYYWNLCNTIALKTRRIVTPPKDTTDLEFIAGVNGDTLAKDYFENFLNWMYNREIELPFHFNTAGEWEECTRFNLQLPHHTDNQYYECIAQKITVEPNAPYRTTVNAIIYGQVGGSSEDFSIVETLDLQNNDSGDWVETLQVYDSNNDIQEVL